MYILFSVKKAETQQEKIMLALVSKFIFINLYATKHIFSLHFLKKYEYNITSMCNANQIFEIFKEKKNLQNCFFLRFNFHNNIIAK